MALITEAEMAVLIARLAGAAETMNGLRDTLGPLIEEWTNGQAGAVLNNLPTIALNANGTFGTPDGSPVPGNPINPNLVSGLPQNLATPPTPFNTGALFNLAQQYMLLVTGQSAVYATAEPILDSFRP